MSDRYDIFYAGKIADGFDPAAVRANLAKLFKANEQTLEKLFSGKPQLVKRGADKPAAIKYKAAMEKAGAIPLIRKHAEPAAAGAAAPAGKPAKQQTMAERLAALTGEAAPDPGAAREPAAGTAPEPAASAGEMAAAAAAGSATGATAAGFDSAMTLAPSGADVLREDEREVVEELDIDTSAIQLAPEFAEPEPRQQAELPAPDTSHLSMGEVGEDIPHLQEAQELLDPDTSHLSMGEVGEDIPQLPDEREPVNPDTSGLDLAPEGSDVLDEQYKKREQAAAPDTSHISLDDPA